MSTSIIGPILVLDAEAGIVAETTGSSTEIADVDYGLVNVQDRTHPLRTFRTTDTASASKVLMDVPSGTVLAGCFVDNVNFDGEVTFHTFNSALGNQLTVTADSAGKTIVKDPFTGRRKVYVRFDSTVTFNGSTIDKIRVIAGGSTTLAADAAYTAGFEWGAVTYVEEGNELGLEGGKINNISYSITDPQIVTKFPGGAIEPVEVGERFVTINIPSRDYLEDSQTAILDVFLNRTTPIIFFENDGNLGRAYTTRAVINKATKVQYKVTGEVFSLTIGLIETI